MTKSSPGKSNNSKDNSSENVNNNASSGNSSKDLLLDNSDNINNELVNDNNSMINETKTTNKNSNLSYLPSCINIIGFHGKMVPKKRTLLYKKFVALDSGVLFCTDVAARGVSVWRLKNVMSYNNNIAIM